MSTSARLKAKKVFNYTNLDAETSQFVQQQTGEIRALMKRTAQGIVEIGQKLIEVKARLEYGRFGDWIEAEFEWGEWTAQKFMQVAQQFRTVNFTELQIAPSALYELAAPSVPAPARKEAIARAEAGEPITYTAAKAIKKKYASPPTKPKTELKSKAKPKPEPEPALQPLPTPTLAPLPQLISNLEIVSIRPQGQAKAMEAAPALSVPHSSQPVYAPEQTGIWWRLRGRHFLYCGEPNSPEFLRRTEEETEKLGLLLAFPPTTDWMPAIRARALLIFEDLPQGKDLRLFEDTLESIVLLYSRLNNLVVNCFLPLPEILSIINRLDRRGLFAEPDERRCQAVIADWKRAGLKVERMS